MKKAIFAIVLIFGCSEVPKQDVNTHDDSMIIGALVQEYLVKCRSFNGLFRQGVTGNEIPVVMKILIDTMDQKLDSSKVKAWLSQEVHYELIGKMNHLKSWGKNYKSNLNLDTTNSRWSTDSELDSIGLQLVNSVNLKPDSIYCGHLKIGRPAINMNRTKAVVAFESLNDLQFAVFERDSIWKYVKIIYTSIE